MLIQGQPLFFADVVIAAAAGEITSNRGPRLHDWWTKSPPPDPEDIVPDEGVLHVSEIGKFSVEVGEYRGIVFRRSIEERDPAGAKQPEPGIELFKAAIKLAPISPAKAARLLEIENRKKLWSETAKEAVGEEISGATREERLEHLRGWWNAKEAAAQQRALENHKKLHEASRACGKQDAMRAREKEIAAIRGIIAENPRQASAWKDVLKNEYGVVL